MADLHATFVAEALMKHAYGETKGMIRGVCSHTSEGFVFQVIRPFSGGSDIEKQMSDNPWSPESEESLKAAQSAAGPVTVKERGWQNRTAALSSVLRNRPGAWHSRGSVGRLGLHDDARVGSGQTRRPHDHSRAVLPRFRPIRPGHRTRRARSERRAHGPLPAPAGQSPGRRIRADRVVELRRCCARGAKRSAQGGSDRSRSFLSRVPRRGRRSWNARSGDQRVAPIPCDRRRGACRRVHSNPAPPRPGPGVRRLEPLSGDPSPRLHPRAHNSQASPSSTPA